MRLRKKLHGIKSTKSFVMMAGLLAFAFSASISAQANPYVGEIRMFAGNFAPVGWALCNGQLLPISQNTALFSILGTTYGGDGKTTFALPDLRGRVAVAWGTGAGLTARTIGDTGGQETVTLTAAQMPQHTHAIVLSADSTVGTAERPNSGIPARNAAAVPSYGTSANASLGSAAATAGMAGGNQPHQNMQPFLCVTFIISLAGIFPSQN